jgi:methylphosphotriester-DNA--protein-cysteine methyltransferase
MEQATQRTLGEDTMWRAVEIRDRSLDGRFLTCVRTTGIYCKPSCAGRPLRRNVQFVASWQEAEAAGYLACKRCRPKG